MRADDQQRGWAAAKDLRWRRCPDCDLRGALHADGHVLRHPKHGFRLTVGCETCEERGYIPATSPLDPYVSGR